MEYVWLLLPLALPLMGYTAAWFLGGRRPWLAILVAALAGSAVLAFIGMAVSALASAVDPGDAAFRGAWIGLGAGGVMGALADLGRRLLTRGFRTPTPTEPT